MKVVSGKLIRKNLQSAKSIKKMIPSIFEKEQLDEVIKAIKNIKYKIGKY